MEDKLDLINTITNDMFDDSVLTKFKLKDGLLISFLDIESSLVIPCDSITENQSPKEIISLLNKTFIGANLNIISIAENNILKRINKI